MAKCMIVTDAHGNFWGIEFHCPGCALIRGHGDGTIVLPVRWIPPGMTESGYNTGRDHWDFNGDFDKPVFGPSVLSRQTMHEPPVTPDNYKLWKEAPWEQHKVEHVCHSFVGCNGAQPGQIIFLNDCTHALAGKVVELPELREPVRFKLSELEP